MGSGLVANFTIPEVQTSLICPKGHKLHKIEGGIQPIDLGTVFHVEGYLFCPKCRDIYRQSLNELQEGQTTVYFIHRSGNKIIEETTKIDLVNVDTFLSETLGVARKLLNRIKGVI